jgi:hypothetical protein
MRAEPGALSTPRHRHAEQKCCQQRPERIFAGDVAETAPTPCAACLMPSEACSTTDGSSAAGSAPSTGDKGKLSAILQAEAQQF